MKAILTKCLPCTNTKPRRIVAYTEGGNRITRSWYELEEDAERIQGDMAQATVHKVAAYALCYKMKWSGILVGGSTPEGYAFCFLDSKI